MDNVVRKIGKIVAPKRALNNVWLSSKATRNGNNYEATLYYSPQSGFTPSIETIGEIFADSEGDIEILDGNNKIDLSPLAFTYLCSAGHGSKDYLSPLADEILKTDAAKTIRSMQKKHMQIFFIPALFGEFGVNLYTMNGKNKEYKDLDSLLGEFLGALLRTDPKERRRILKRYVKEVLF